MESTIKIIEGILTRIVQLHKKDWIDRIPKALCTYRTTWKDTIGLTSYDILYGKKVLFCYRVLYQNLQDCSRIGDGLNRGTKKKDFLAKSIG